MTGNRLNLDAAEPTPDGIDRGNLARRLLTTPPHTVHLPTGPTQGRQVRLHHIAVALLAGYRAGALLDYEIVRQAIRHNQWATVHIDWPLLAQFADDMAGASSVARQRAAYGSGASRRAVRYILAAAAAIALDEITPAETRDLARAFTALADEQRHR